MLKRTLATVAALALGSSAALAHVSLQLTEAPVGSTYRAIFQVPHGCEGNPTNVVRVQIPEGVIAVKPQPKACWMLEKIKGAYAKSYDYYGTPTSEGVKEIVWSGGNLGDDEYDEFVFRAYITDTFKPGQTVAFPVVQECEGGATTRWIEVPAEGKSADDYQHPAPTIKIVDK